MQSNAFDTPFHGQDLHEATFALTFFQNSTAQAHQIHAIHTSQTGKQTRFIVELRDAMRRAQFASTIGQLIQGRFSARCDIVFARRDAERTDPNATFAPKWDGDTCDTSTPNSRLPAMDITGTGIWDTAGPEGLVFVLAAWSYTDIFGEPATGGWHPAPAAQAA